MLRTFGTDAPTILVDALQDVDDSSPSVTSDRDVTVRLCCCDFMLYAIDPKSSIMHTLLEITSQIRGLIESYLEASKTLGDCKKV